MPYTVVKTPCFPCAWKVQPLPPLRDDNATHNYFRTENEAVREMKKRNAMDKSLALEDWEDSAKRYEAV